MINNPINSIQIRLSIATTTNISLNSCIRIVNHISSPPIIVSSNNTISSLTLERKIITIIIIVPLTIIITLTIYTIIITIVNIHLILKKIQETIQNQITTKNQNQNYQIVNVNRKIISNNQQSHHHLNRRHPHKNQHFFVVDVSQFLVYGRRHLMLQQQ